MSLKTVSSVTIAKLEAAEVRAASNLGSEITSTRLVKWGDVEVC